jgi:hypothetical protein
MKTFFIIFGCLLAALWSVSMLGLDTLPAIVGIAVFHAVYQLIENRDWAIDWVKNLFR